ncbi:MAG: type II secretion system protein GspL [Pseudomonadota bacterium]
MAEVLVLQLGDDAASAAHWIVVDSSGARVSAPVMGPLSAARVDAADRKIVVLVPAADVLSTEASIPVKAPAKILAALPYALEESVADDIEDLHFAAGARDEDGRVPVAVVNRSCMQAWLETLEKAAIEPHALIAENAGLAMIPGTISLMLAGDAVFINDGQSTELVMHGIGPEEALQAIGALDRDDADEEGPGLPGHVLVYCDANAEATWSTHFSALRAQFESFDVKVLPDGQLPRLAVTVAAGAGINLLQGEYAPKAEYGGYFRPWRIAAALLLAVGVIGLLGLGLDNFRLSQQETELKARFLEEYREIAPGATDVRDPIAVISSLRGRTGTSGGESSMFLQSLEQLSAAMQANAAASIQAISYRGSVVDIRLTAPSVSVLDDIQRRIDQGGSFEAEIQGTTPDGDKVNSRIQIRVAGL